MAVPIPAIIAAGKPVSGNEPPPAATLPPVPGAEPPPPPDVPVAAS